MAPSESALLLAKEVDLETELELECCKVFVVLKEDKVMLWVTAAPLPVTRGELALQ